MVEVIQMAWEECPRYFQPMLMGKLNTCIRDSIGEREEHIMNIGDKADLVNLA